MELMEAIQNRRSIRKFTDQPISREDLETIMEAVRWAPSWANTQIWEVIAVTKPELKQALAGLLFKNPATKAMINAPVVLAMVAKLKVSGYYSGQPTTDKDDWFLYDTGLATQNLCLTAHGLGLGTVIVGLFDSTKAAEILGVPEGYMVVSLIPAGHPDQSPRPPRRRAAKDFTHYDRF